MGQPKDYTIDKVSWHTNVDGNPETPERVRARFQIVAQFLQRRGLTVRALLLDDQVPGGNFSIRTSDLTEEGLAVMKKGYDKWLKKIANKNKDLSDLRILEEALREVRQETRP
ncbi:MAG TPA: hypothetical protein VMS17_12075 [Gemmataceae bacterium]|nr:hypothetical protein [Gemmataceae bacterium]